MNENIHEFSEDEEGGTYKDSQLECMFLTQEEDEGLNDKTKDEHKNCNIRLMSLFFSCACRVLVSTFGFTFHNDNL